MNNLMRDNLDDSYGIVPLQNAILNITQYVDRFCIEHNIEYCLMGGSALGAKRHKGFIPWDDDLDIFMTPDNFEKFRAEFLKSGDIDTYYLQEWGAVNGMVTTAKIRLNESCYIEDVIKDWDIHQGIYIDIFILHRCPDKRLPRYWQYIWAKYIILKGLSNKEYNRRTGIIPLVLKAMKLLPKRFLLGYGLKQVYRFRNCKSGFYCNYLGKALMKNGTYKEAYFNGTKRLPFETIELCVPAKIEEFLTERFGDYMKPPSAERIKYEQHASYWSLSEPFDGYVPGKNYTDEKYLI